VDYISVEDQVMRLRHAAGTLTAGLAVLLAPASARAQDDPVCNPIVAWGYDDLGQCNVPEPNEDFEAVAGGRRHSLGLKGDDSIVAWGYNEQGQCDVPEPNREFVAVAAGAYHSLGLWPNGSVVAWGDNDGGECDVPPPNTGFVAGAACRKTSPATASSMSSICWSSSRRASRVE
jgi:hypothetical protein